VLLRILRGHPSEVELNLGEELGVVHFRKRTALLEMTARIVQTAQAELVMLLRAISVARLRPGDPRECGRYVYL